MTEDRILAVDLMSLINDQVEANLKTASPMTFGEILYALRVCAAVVLGEIKDEEKRQGYIQHHMIGSAEMLGIPLIPMEVDMPSKESMN